MNQINNSPATEISKQDMLVIIATKLYKAGASRKQVLKVVKRLSTLPIHELEREFNSCF